MTHPRVAILYLCHNDLRYVPEVVEALAEQSYPQEAMRVYFLPNGATDGVQDYVREHVFTRTDVPECLLLDDSVNRGFAGGNNRGIKEALEWGAEYIFLHNGDLKLEPHSIERLVECMQSDERIGSVQPLVLHWNKPEGINVSGGVMHVAGFGYARDNGTPLVDFSRDPRQPLCYVSGAAAMYRSCALRKVGLLEERFFMYHEDLELGLRLQFAGYENRLCTQAHALHDYTFSRNPKKFQWMETYRYVVLAGYAKGRTLALLVPILFGIEIAMWGFALTGGWFAQKVYADLELLRPRTWKFICDMRKRARALRTIEDRVWLARVSARIEAQETNSAFVRVGNSVLEALWKRIYSLIRW